MPTDGVLVRAAVLDQMSGVLDIFDGDEINSVVGNLIVKEATTYLFKVSLFVPSFLRFFILSFCQ
jgi:hypothetical protein